MANNRKKTRGRKFHYITKKADDKGNRQVIMSYHANPKAKGKKQDKKDVVQNITERRQCKVMQPSTYGD